ncbi:polysaccharide deacetylase family protein [Paenibacillus sp. FJAT-27812]|uniref:polysaccharide deacetylase family protein n=1 Tax=Paenibacillus sp. FJAT-27812 TaxID=1684143 RepID=UPI0006A75B9B|nr:polysaccharide deacetylase family protein [Paenibacillus sp. FJAT-27812]
MDRIKQTAIASVIAVAMMVGWLTSGCSNDKKVNLQFVVNDNKIETKASARIRDGRLMVPEAYLEEISQKQIEWLTLPPKNEGAYYSDEVAVLMYHDIKPVPKGDSIIAVERFEKQMSLLKQNGFKVISLAQYESFMLANGEVPDNAVLITFDDGYESFYQYAFPILKKYGYSAVSFVIVSSVGDHTKPETTKLGWDQMRAMQKEGMSFRSHTYDMHQYSAVNEAGDTTPVMVRPIYDKKNQRIETKDEYVKRVIADLRKAEESLRSELGNTQSAIAFPFGAYNAVVSELTNEAGIPIRFSTREGINTRFHHTGYRVNGAKTGETEEELIEKLKHLGDRTEKNGDAAILIMDGQEAVDIGFSKNQDTQENLISLRDFCHFFNWTIKWDRRHKLVEIKTLETPFLAEKT